MNRSPDVNGKLNPTTQSLTSRRIVLLGASNVSRGISTVFETSRLAAGGPVEFIAAIGRGRSYGIESRLLGRRLQGIANCGLWRSLAEHPKQETFAVVTDIGNDILYGIPVPQIAQWVEHCLDRLLSQNATIVMTLLPIANVVGLTPRRFQIVRRLLFPRNRFTLEEVLASAMELNDLVRQLGEERGLQLISPRTEWYGFDPIHIQMRSWSRAWKEILSFWPQACAHECATRSFRRWLKLTMLPTEQQVLWGFERGKPQPVAHLRDGSTISLY